MVHINTLFKSFKAGWVKRLQFSDPTVHSWSQLANFNFQLLAKCNTNLCFNFDDKVEFKEVTQVKLFLQKCILLFQ